MNNAIPDESIPWTRRIAQPPPAILPLEFLPGPHWLEHKFPTKASFIEAFQTARAATTFVPFIESLATELAGDTAINMVMPFVVPSQSEPKICNFVYVAHPDDAGRLGRIHLKKSRAQWTPYLRGDNVVSTPDIELWQEQRRHLVEAFLPLSSLAKVMPVSVLRAKWAMDHKLGPLSRAGSRFDLLELFNVETLSQFHLVLLGETREFSDAHNASFRSNLRDVTRAGQSRNHVALQSIASYSKEVLNRAANAALATPSEALTQGCPVRGPVAASLASLHPTRYSRLDKLRVDNTMALSFAGFDTTANTLSWLVLELCRQPALQSRLHAELDEIAAKLNGRDLAYADLGLFVFTSKLINETLRLWNPAALGSVRELSFDEEIEGPNQTRIHLPKGTNVWLPIVALHRSRLLWGADAHEFNPDREWLPEERWFDMPFAAMNPASHRYAPFMFTPRGCLGLNFAQMESRIIIYYMFRSIRFALAEPTLSQAPAAATVQGFLGAEHITISPRGGLWVTCAPRGGGRL